MVRFLRLNDTNVINVDQIVLIERKGRAFFLQMASMPGITFDEDSESIALWDWIQSQVSVVMPARSEQPQEVS